MKFIFVACIVGILICSCCRAQCRKNVQLTSDTTSFIDQSGNLVRSKPETVVIHIKDSLINITVSEDGQQRDRLTGNIKPVSCQWKLPYKEGKTVIHTTLSDQSGDHKDAVLTIEGKVGRITFLLEPEMTTDNKIRLSVKKFAEEK